MLPQPMGVIRIVTKEGKLYARGIFVGPYCNEKGEWCDGVAARFQLIDDQAQSAPKHFVRLVMMGPDREEGNDTAWAVRCLGAVAPHILAAYVDSPGNLPMVQDKVVNVDKWLEGSAAATVSNTDLAAVLDGGIANHRRLCRADVLRVLIQHYDVHGSGHRVAESGILESPIRRRFYDPELVFGVLRDLVAEGLIGGLNREYWVSPEKCREARIEVEDIERVFSGKGPSSARVFVAGQRFQAWEELRSFIVSAKQYVWIEDAWLGSNTVAMLGGNLQPGVHLRVLGPEKDNRRWRAALALLKVLGEEIPDRVEVRCTPDVHDRYVYVDGHARRSSESFEDMAKKRTTKLIPEAKPEETCADFEKRWSAARRVYPE